MLKKIKTVWKKVLAAFRGETTVLVVAKIGNTIFVESSWGVMGMINPFQNMEGFKSYKPVDFVIGQKLKVCYSKLDFPLRSYFYEADDQNSNFVSLIYDNDNRWLGLNINQVKQNSPTGYLDCCFVYGLPDNGLFRSKDVVPCYKGETKYLAVYNLI